MKMLKLLLCAAIVVAAIQSVVQEEWDVLAWIIISATWFLESWAKGLENERLRSLLVGDSR